jgi:quinol monooxygenase YgiN
MVVIYRWQPPPRERSVMPERVGSAVAAGLRFARYAPALHAVLARTAAFIFAASALWALLPVVATQELGLGALGYGVMLASIGLGAVGGAAVLPRMRARMSIDRLTIALTLIFAAGLCVLAFVHNVLVVNAALLAVGVGWLTINSFLNVTAQTTAPAWVQARALGVYLLVSQGGLAGGSALWGVVADQFGAPTALAAAAALLVVGCVTAWRWPLRADEGLDLRPSQHWPAPELAREPTAEDGPVLVTVEYRVAEEQQAAFCEAMEAVALIRRRDGALRWELFRDTADPERLLETFEVASWAEHLRQHERVTVADSEVEARAQAFRIAGTASAVSHFIATSAVTKKSVGK